MNSPTTRLTTTRHIRTTFSMRCQFTMVASLLRQMTDLITNRRLSVGRKSRRQVTVGDCCGGGGATGPGGGVTGGPFTGFAGGPGRW